MDIVITYVDINDEFIKKYNKYNSKLQENRFTSYNVLDLQVKLIRKYASFIKNIFIVVSDKSQVPKNLDLSLCKIVYHKDIIPEKFLPCFNSCTIEMFLHNIPELDEEFIYFNDDVFIIDYVSKKEFFLNHKPSLTVSIKDINPDEKNVYKKNLYNSTDLITKYLKIENKYKNKYISISHSYFPMLKSVCKKVFDKNIYSIYGSLTRIRNSKNYNTSIFHNYNYLTKNYHELERNYTYYSSMDSMNKICDAIIKKENKFICINNENTYEDFNAFKTELHNALKANLEEKEYIFPVKKYVNINSSQQDNIYVSFTSWTKRIQYCKHTIDLMMNQTLMPTKIILNLAEEEFPNREEDLPKELVDESINNELFEIFWVKENNTVWKKIIPTMNRFPNDLVLSIDDDIEYPNNYIEEMYNTYLEYNKTCPVVAYEHLINGELCHSGPFTLTSKKFYDELLNKVYNELILTIDEKWASDIVYFKVAQTLGYKYVKCNAINGNILYKTSELNKENRYSIWSLEYKRQRNKDISLLNNYLKNNYVNIKNFKKVVYTCITGNYDNLIEPGYVSEDFDYICFTDNINLKSNVWKILPIPEDLLSLPKVKQQRNIKINTHKYLKEYDISIWVDSSVKLSDNINNVLKTLDFSKYNIFITTHPQRDCIYKEGEACIKLKKDTKESIETELNAFKISGMPENYGLLETNVIIKMHNDHDCITLMELWAALLNKYSHRDQISLPYALWLLNYNKLCKLPIGFNHTSYFNWIGGLHKKINICIIHYNTPELTNALIKSINKYVKRAVIYLFDNSTIKPFTYKYDNLIYLDNTNGQYINFDEWLEQYPTRLLSKEHIGNYGSARHSISVQKCIELINENFILMDSDILLKRDISGFINSRYIYVGENELQKNGKYRVLPFCLFINVDMCKKYNVPWFDENYMHGLHITKEADRYDTGGAFYVHTRNYPSKEVNLNSFIVHYKGGSWEDKYMKIHNLTLTSKEWLEINKKYWED